MDHHHNVQCSTRSRFLISTLRCSIYINTRVKGEGKTEDKQINGRSNIAFCKLWVGIVVKIAFVNQLVPIAFCKQVVIDITGHDSSSPFSFVCIHLFVFCWFFSLRQSFLYEYIVSIGVCWDLEPTMSNLVEDWTGRWSTIRASSCEFIFFWLLLTLLPSGFCTHCM